MGGPTSPRAGLECLSALAAVPLARRVGMVNTMLFSHPPSSFLVMAVPALAAMPFVLSGGIKAACDVALWLLFRRVRPPEERGVNGS